MKNPFVVSGGIGPLKNLNQGPQPGGTTSAGNEIKEPTPWIP